MSTKIEIIDHCKPEPVKAKPIEVWGRLQDTMVKSGPYDCPFFYPVSGGRLTFLTNCDCGGIENIKIVERITDKINHAYDNKSLDLIKVTMKDGSYLLYLGFWNDGVLE